VFFSAIHAEVVAISRCLKAEARAGLARVGLARAGLMTARHADAKRRAAMVISLMVNLTEFKQIETTQL